MDAWRKDCSTVRPHQSLAMAFPAGRFTAPAATVSACGYPPG